MIARDKPACVTTSRAAGFLGLHTEARRSTKRNAAAVGALKARTQGISMWRSAALTLKAGLCFCALAQPQFCLRLLTLGGRWGCAGPGRSTGPPLLHWLIERLMVVSGLGYTPGPPVTDVPRFRTPLVPSGGVRLSLTRAAAFDPHLGRVCCRVLT